MPPPFDKLEGLTRLVALRCIRPDKVVLAVRVSILQNEQWRNYRGFSCQVAGGP